MKEVLIEWEGLNKQGENVWIGKGGGSSALVITMGNLPSGNEAETIEV